MCGGTRPRRSDTNNSEAATLILNDDVDGAESGLSTGSSTFHNVGDRHYGL